MVFIVGTVEDGCWMDVWVSCQGTFINGISKIASDKVSPGFGPRFREKQSKLHGYEDPQLGGPVGLG